MLVEEALDPIGLHQAPTHSRGEAKLDGCYCAPLDGALDLGRHKAVPEAAPRLAVGADKEYAMEQSVRPIPAFDHRRTGACTELMSYGMLAHGALPGRTKDDPRARE